MDTILNKPVTKSFHQKMLQTTINTKVQHINNDYLHSDTLHFGSMHEAMVGESSKNFHFANDYENIVAFSKTLNNEEVLIVYNNSLIDAKEPCIKINDEINRDRHWMKSLYGYTSNSLLQIVHAPNAKENLTYVKLYLQPKQLVMLKSF